MLNIEDFSVHKGRYHDSFSNVNVSKIHTHLKLKFSDYEKEKYHHFGLLSTSKINLRKKYSSANS